MSRSSLVFGQFSIVWGIACALLTWILYRYRDKSNWFIFLFGTILGGAYEYICSVFTEIAFGTVFWDYSKIPFNLGGRINLLYCFFWGFAAVIWMKAVYPVFVKTDRTIAEKGGTYHLLLAACCSDGGYGAVICRFGALRRTSGRKRRKRDYRWKVRWVFPGSVYRETVWKSENSEINKTDKTKNRNVPFGASGFCWCAALRREIMIWNSETAVREESPDHLASILCL